MSVNEEMNSVGSRIPSKWKRTTVADGDWLQKYTLDPLSARDEFLASKIQESIDGLAAESAARIEADNFISGEFDDLYKDFTSFSANTSANIDYLSGCIDDINDNIESMSSTIDTKIDNLQDQIDQEIEDRTEEDIDLQKQIDTLKAATDVIDVWGTYDSFSSYSATKYFPVGEDPLITNNDIIKILNDEVSSPVNHQSYWQCSFPEHQDPTSSNCTWSFIGYVDPYYNTAEIDEKFDGISSTISNNYLSAKGAVLTGRNIVITEDPNNPKITIATKDVVDFDKVSATTAYGSSAKFDNISATTLTALTATGNSAKFTNVSSQNLSSTNISATNLSATNASGTSAIYDNLSSNKLYALTASGNSAKFTNISSTTAEIDTLSSNHITVYDKNNLPDTLNVQISNSGFTAINSNNLTYPMSSYSSIYDCSGITYKTFYINTDNQRVEYKATVTPNQIYSWDWATDFAAYGHLSAWSVNHELAKVRYNKMSLSAGDGIAIHVYDKTPDLPVSASGYNAIKISADANLLGSAYNGQSAYDYITNTFSTAYWSAYKDNSHRGTGDLSASFSISAGNNLDLSVENGVIKLDAKPTGLTSISAGGNGNVNKNYTDKLSLSATSPVKFVTADNNVLGVGVESATLQAGQGISFYKAGTNILGISADAQSPEPGRCIEVGDDNSINLSSRIDVSGGVVVSSNISTLTYVDITPEQINLYEAGRPGPQTIFQAGYLSASAPDGGHLTSVTASATWYDIANAKNEYVRVSTGASGSILSANTAITFVVTSTMPVNFAENTYYIV